mmetsp:Transcript_17223/g.51417  ORF Transcript_17223/g.51417 Transcript_17223/m.51417 type:complete len:222 (-) Transcript_17223:229-894(-)
MPAASSVRVRCHRRGDSRRRPLDHGARGAVRPAGGPILRALRVFDARTGARPGDVGRPPVHGLLLAGDVRTGAGVAEHLREPIFAALPLRARLVPPEAAPHLGPDAAASTAPRDCCLSLLRARRGQRRRGLSLFHGRRLRRGHLLFVHGAVDHRAHPGVPAVGRGPRVFVLLHPLGHGPADAHRRGPLRALPHLPRPRGARAGVRSPHDGRVTTTDVHAID